MKAFYKVNYSAVQGVQMEEHNGYGCGFSCASHNRANAIDASNKSRLNHAGEHNSQHKLSEIAVRAIRDLKGTFSGAEIARRFGVSRTLVNGILSGKRLRTTARTIRVRTNERSH